MPMLVQFTSDTLLFMVLNPRLLTYYMLKGNLFKMGHRLKGREVTCSQNSPKSQDNYQRSTYI